MKMRHALLGVAAMLAFAAADVNANAQTLQFAAVGSSALYTELGQAAATLLGCYATTTSKSQVFPIDQRVGTAPGTAESTNAWVAWSVGNGTSCSAPGSSSVIYTMMSADSTIGNRCFFASPRCLISVPAAGFGGGGQLPGFTAETDVPTSIQGAMNDALVNVAATDIRPEDAKFATMRALTNCGTAVTSGSQYLGLGYQGTATGVGVAVQQSAAAHGGTGTSFNVFDFNLIGNDPIKPANTLPTGFTVTPVGAVPVVVVVNPENANGFGSLQVTNIDRGVLAGYLDGTFGRTSDILAQAYTSSNALDSATTIFVREPVSGTYNTMEYAIPNNVAIQSSQDVGVQATLGNAVPVLNCSGTKVNQNPLSETVTRGTEGTSARYRAIGTSNELASVFATKDSLGYGFWSAGNFASATAATAKYLTVDGVDPIQASWIDGLVPTSGNGILGNVTLQHVRDGSYPIWSLLRLVSDTSGVGLSSAKTLVSEAYDFLSPSQPDFVAYPSLLVVRSHFTPPLFGTTFDGVAVNFPSAAGTNVASNGTSGCGESAEAGGDVGGIVYTQQSDCDYNVDNGTGVGNTARRQ
jgi:hypothetical protein